MLTYYGHCVTCENITCIVGKNFPSIPPPKKFFSSIFLKLHSIVVLVNVIQSPKGDSSSTTGFQHTGAHIFDVLTRVPLFN